MERTRTFGIQHSTVTVLTDDLNCTDGPAVAIGCDIDIDILSTCGLDTKGPILLPPVLSACPLYTNSSVGVGKRGEY